jgi:tetratricopeptide (TPR) repeat protein
MLCAEAHSLLDRWPAFSAALAAAAIEIAKRLAVPVASRQFLLAMALRERANALRYLGSLREALEALAEAEKLFKAGDPSLAPFELAIVSYIRGTVLIQSDETTADALAISVRAAETFRTYGDQSREMSARLLNGLALLHLRRPAEALKVFEELIADARRVDHKSLVAYGFQSAALASTELNDLDEAERHFADALAIYDEIGLRIEQARVAWALAAIPVARGRLEEGAAALEVARRELLRLGLKNDHGLATLEWAEVRLALGRPDGVAAACRQLIMEFDSEGMKQKARLALAYVHEALARQRATPALLRSVRTYLAQLPRRPGVAFTPPS